MFLREWYASCWDEFRSKFFSLRKDLIDFVAVLHLLSRKAFNWATSPEHSTPLSDILSSNVSNCPSKPWT